MIQTASAPAVNRRQVVLTLPTFHAGQETARAAFERCRFLVLYCGRQWGKTRFCAVMAVATALRGKMVWWISPTYPMSDIVWRMLCGLVRGMPDTTVRESGRRIVFPGGGEISVKSSDNPDSLRGPSLDLAILDEAAYQRESVWTDALRAALSARKGKAIFATTPAGINWMHDLFLRGQLDDPEWTSLRFKTADNPYIDPAEIASARALLPAPIFAQEYEALPGAGDRGVIPLEWIVLANERWQAWSDAGRKIDGPIIAACDVSEGGDGADTCALAVRCGWVVMEVRDVTPDRRGDMLPIGDKIVAAVQGGKPGGYAIIDAVGVGAMLPAYIKGAGVISYGFKGGRSTKLRDPSGMFGFADVNAAAWWNMRALMDPENGPGIALPPNKRLMQGLTIRQYEERAGQTIAIERKKVLNPKLGFSPDEADAVVMAFWDRQIMRPRGA